MADELLVDLWPAECDIDGAGVLSCTFWPITVSIVGAEKGDIEATLHGPTAIMYSGGAIDAEIPFLSVAMESTHAPGSISIRLKRVRVSMNGGWAPGGSISTTLWPITISATGYGGPTSMEVTLWSIDVYIQGSGDTYTTIVASTKDGSVTTYSNFSFNSYFEMDGRFFGISSSGIYELMGTTDSGVNILSTITTGFTRMKATKPLSLNDLYALITSDGTVTFRGIIDKIMGAEYEMETTYGRYRYRKLDIGKGRIGFKVGLNISTSSPFTLDLVKLVCDEKTRIPCGDEGYMKIEVPVVEVSV